jgi:hypothetical protein
MDGLAVRRTALLGVPGRAIVHQRRELAGRMKLCFAGIDRVRRKDERPI